jgi:hypothetical protein
MSDQNDGECTFCMERVSDRLGGRVREIRLQIREGGIVLQGVALSYHAKQLALQAVMEATDLPICANEIRVHSARPPRFA